MRRPPPRAASRSRSCTINSLERAAAASPWAAAHPGDKALLLLGLLLLAISLPPLPALPLIAVALALLAVRAQVPWGLYLSRIAAPGAFVAVGLGPLIFTLSAEGLTLIPGGPANAATVLARCVVGMAAVMLFALSTPMAAQIELMRRCRLPDAIVHVVIIMYRMISTLISTSRAMWEAQAARLGHSSWRRWLRSVGEQGATLFVLALTRARALEEGLELRAEPGATSMPARFNPSRPRVIAAALGLQSAIILLSLIAL